MTGTIEKYLSQIMEVTHVPGIYAYRGQQDLCWPLHSAATRRLIERYGKDLLEDPEFPQLYINYHQETLIEPARTRGFGTDSGRRLSDLELLAKLQHFGAATGLLDFTWSPLVALWFACEDTKYDGKLLIVDTNVAGTVGWVSSNEEDQNLESAFSGAAGSPQFSYWEPTVTSDASVRILRQRSVFIIGRPLVPVGEEIIKEITIAKEDKQSLKKELATLDVQEDSLFQDIYGFAQAKLKPR